jgi:hypothetical protein
MGHVPSFKNKKRVARKRNGPLFLMTEPKTKKWMDACIQSFVLQFTSVSQITEGVMLTGPYQVFWTALSLPLDDSLQWVPEQHVYCEEVEKGKEGATIIIEEL